MSIVEDFVQLVIEPLLAVYDGVFRTIQDVVHSPGAALILFGVVLNLALTPLYYRMERTGKERAEGRKAMDGEIARMKAHYKGRELYYYTRTIHRRYRFSPISVVLTSGTLYLELFVFITVAIYIESLWTLTGTRFLRIPDLSQPDALLGGINMLPLLMTALNVGSAILYSPSPRARRTSLLLAAVFLLLLYRSPSGLVLYWTSSNAFSLTRNLAERRLVRQIPLQVRERLARLLQQE